ncbi:glutamate receptor 2-like [Zootermopsis nevadensis]|nr:glutamate receptor 2-like [Zootermopsis nevadensis]
MLGSDKEEEMDETEVRYTEGLDIRLLHFMAKCLNASVKFVPPPIGVRNDANNTWGGVAGDVIGRRADIGMGATSYIYSIVRDLDFTVPYDVLEVVWAVPRAKARPRWGSITRVFHLPMWLLLMGVMVVAAGAMLCLSKYKAKYQQGRSEYTTLSGCLSSAWAAMLGVGVPVQPRSGPLRIIFIAWVIHSLAVSTVFQAFMTSFLVDPGLEKQIMNVEDLLTSGFHYGVHKIFFGYLFFLQIKQRDVMLPNTDICVKVEECAQKVADEGNYATILNSITAEYLNTYKTSDNNGVGKLYMLEEKLSTNFQVFILPRGSEFLGTFNRLVTVANEAGLVTHFWKEMLTTNKIKARSITEPVGDGYEVYTIIHLQSAFYLLLLGYCTAFCVFFAEIIHQKWRTRRRRQNKIRFLERRVRRCLRRRRVAW